MSRRNLQLLVGLNIKKHRKVKNMTQHDLALKLNFEQTYISRIELGKRNLTLQNINLIAKALNVKPDELLK